MDKLISLQRAIDAVHKNYDTILDFTSDGKTISSSIEDILSELPSAEPESISKWKKEFREYVDSLDIARDDWKGIIEYIDELPSAQPERKKGEWIHQAKFSRIECDQCGKVFRNTFAPKNFCPNCGADMKGKTNG